MKCNSTHRESNYSTSGYQSIALPTKSRKKYEQILMDKILVSILTHRCQCPHDRLKRGGDRGGATHIYKRKLSSEPHVKKRYKLGNHLFHTPAQNMGSPWDVATVPKRHLRDVIGSGVCYLGWIAVLLAQPALPNLKICCIAVFFGQTVLPSF